MKILHLEDNARDALLVQDMLEIEWPAAVVTLVSTRETFVAELERGGHDLILSDFKLAGFSGQDALHLARSRRPDVPFIFLSGTVGEETAVELVRGGAADYLLKDRMQRLPLAIQRALADRVDRQQHRRAEERIREQAELLDKASDGIVVTDLADIVRFWNRGAERILGWTAAEMVGQSIVPIIGRTLAHGMDAAQRPVTADEWHGELPLMSKQGQPLVTEIRVTLIRDAAGVPKSRLEIVTDITERKKLEEQFLRAQRMESLGMLAAGIAHDLNNALAPMLMAGQILRARTNDPADLHLFDMLERSAGRGAALVKQILSFAGGRNRDKVLIQTKHLLRDIVELVQQTFPKSVVLEHEIPNGLWTVRGNPTQLHQILLNLCINARDAMPAGGTLRLRAENRRLDESMARAMPDGVPGDFLVIEVTDTGTGIPPEIRARIWEPFFTTKGEGKGTGLGLSTVRGIAAGHGGFVRMESEVGRGTTFRVFVPAIADQETAAVAAGSAQPFARGNGELVLVVDDDATIRESINVLLAQQGYRPLPMGDGLEALDHYAMRSGEIALVVTDIDMPRLGGLALADAIRRLNPAVRILFMSGTSGDDAVKQAMNTPGARFLAKPFVSDALLANVHRLLKSRS